MQDQLVIINVLGSDSYNDCHIKYSINISLDELKAYAEPISRDTPIIVYCASYRCSASRSAWHALHDMGFTNVRAYEGGIAEWHQKGYPSEGACSQEYLKVSAEPVRADDAVVTISAEELKAVIDAL